MSLSAHWLPGPSPVQLFLSLLSLPLPTPTFSSPPSLPKNILRTPAITHSFQCLAPHLNNPCVPLYHKTTPKSSCRAVFTRLPPPPNRSRSGFCHQHSTENMPLKIPSLPNWPAWMGFSPHPHPMISPSPSLLSHLDFERHTAPGSCHHPEHSYLDAATPLLPLRPLS